MIIGAQRAGTSSLYRYLGQHPDLIPSLRKETEYFSGYHALGPRWYASHFPLSARVATQARLTGRRPLSFEATPDYLFDPRSPTRVVRELPEVRVIALLRDPVDRAFSHYQHMRRLGFETLSFAEALAAEPERVGPDLERAMDDPSYRPVYALRFSYAARGRYAEQLRRWFDVIPPDRRLVLDASELFADEAAVIRRVCDFVGVRPWVPPQPENHSYRDATAAAAARSRRPEPGVADGLRHSLAADLTALSDLLGWQPAWATTETHATSGGDPA